MSKPYNRSGNSNRVRSNHGIHFGPTDTWMKTVTISNGTEFFRISVSDLADAQADGFYVPGERGLTIVSNGQDIFEVPLDDADSAAQDGFRDLLKAERTARGKQRRAQKTANAPAGLTTAVRLRGVPQSALVTEAVTLDTGMPENVAEPVELETEDEEPVVTEPVALEMDEVEPEALNADEVEVETEDEEELARLAEQEAELEEAAGFSWFVLYLKYRQLPDAEEQKKFMSTYGGSTALHLVALIILGMWIMKSPEPPPAPVISSYVDDSVTPQDDPEQPIEVEVPEPSPEPEPTEMADTDVSDLNLDVDVSDLKPANIPVELAAAGPAVNVPIAGPLAGRSKAGRKSNVKKYGGTPGSEAAVEGALRWLAKHQLRDGSWSFDHSHVGCTCGKPGTEQTRTGATGFALLTIMGAGNTFAEGDYKANVDAGLRYLLNNLNVNSAGYADLKGGTNGHAGIYSHGIAASALCEALSMNNAYIMAMRRDSKLKLTQASGAPLTIKALIQNQRILGEAAQLALNYIVYHQHAAGGGFGYTPKSAGDTSILGWQVMALTGGKTAHLSVPQSTWNGVMNYLDEVQGDGGSFYGYRKPERRPSTTSIGLLCRMYQGWQKSHPPFARGVRFLSQTGPQPNDMYFNYYATQVMFHWGNDGKQNLWDKWNNVMREQLVRTQRKDGHAAGSWDVSDKHGGPGGRLYMTCLSAMTLEIYYRKLPIYKQLEGEGVESPKTARK